MKNFIMSVVPFTSYPYKGDAIDCNLCGSSSKITISETDRRWKNLRTVACTDCGLMRTDPMPTEAELDRYYRDEYRLDYQMTGGKAPRYHVTRSMREAESRAQRLDLALRPGVRVLDFGSGTGEFLKVAKDRGCEVVGIEPGKAYAEMARRAYGVEVIDRPWQQVDFELGSFDVITCHQVVEHLRDPMAALARMSQWLKPDGLLYLSVPDMRANDKPSFERFHFAHIFGFTPETLEVAMRLNGMAPASGTRLESTTAVFRRYETPTPDVGSIRNPERAQVLAASYGKDSVLQYVLSGGHARHAARRFRKWRRDTFMRDAQRA